MKGRSRGEEKRRKREGERKERKEGKTNMLCIAGFLMACSAIPRVSGFKRELKSPSKKRSQKRGMTNRK